MTDRPIGTLGQAMIEQMAPSQRWENMPRPLKYVKPRLYPEDAEYLRELLEAEQGDQERELGRLRALGLPEDNLDVARCRFALTRLASLIREVSLGIIEFARAPAPKED